MKFSNNLVFKVLCSLIIWGMGIYLGYSLGFSEATRNSKRFKKPCLIIIKESEVLPSKIIDNRREV